MLMEIVICLHAPVSNKPPSGGGQLHGEFLGDESKGIPEILFLLLSKEI